MSVEIKREADVAALPGIPWQRCQMHLQQNAQAKLAAWMEDSIPECLTVFAFPAEVRQFLRTNSMEENLNRQIKQRTRLIRQLAVEAGQRDMRGNQR